MVVKGIRSDTTTVGVPMNPSPKNKGGEDSTTGISNKPLKWPQASKKI